MNRLLIAFACSAVFSFLTETLQALEPTVDSIDYSKPSQYLSFPDTLGTLDEITRQAQALKGRSDHATVRRVLQWMDANLKYDSERAYAWRNFDEVVQEGCYGGCADQGIVCGVLLKAAGIPAVWVKTMDVEWIWDFKKGRPFEAWSGHVFLEVYLDDQWVLLDPGAKVIYTEYSPKSRILPGNRFAYHKGNDPKQMIMSLQWEEWKEQTRSYFEQLDTSLLPVDTKSGASVVPHVYIIGNAPYYQAMTAIASDRGWSVRRSFNTDYDNELPRAKGHILLIETHRGVPIIPIATLHKFFPQASNALKTTAGIAEIDGTMIMFVDFAKTLEVLDDDGNEKSVPKKPSDD